MYIVQQSRVCDSDKSPLVAWLPWASLLTDQWEPPHLQLHHCQHHRHHHHHHCRHRHHHHLCRRHRPPPSPTHHHPHPFPHPWLICGNLSLAAFLRSECEWRFVSILIRPHLLFRECRYRSRKFGPKISVLVSKILYDSLTILYFIAQHVYFYTFMCKNHHIC